MYSRAFLSALLSQKGFMRHVVDVERSWIDDLRQRIEKVWPICSFLLNNKKALVS